VPKQRILIRIAQRNADARRIEVAGIETAIIEARRQVEAHDAAAAETELARREELALAAFGLGVRQARRRRQQLSERLGQLERAGDAARAALRAACAELKRLQIAAGAARKHAARRAEARVAEPELVRSGPLPA
jgi:small-conductance mechanosensitive channel